MDQRIQSVMAKLKELQDEDYDWDMCCEALEQSAMDVNVAVKYY